MANSRIKVSISPDGEVEVVIKHYSDPDALPEEHEEDHWEVVENTLGDALDKKALKGARVGNVDGNLNPGKDMKEATPPERQKVEN